jgi:hypothetical protein
MNIETIFTWGIVLLFVLAIAHYVYEMAILPGLRQGLRFDLFALRDELRTIQTEDNRIEAQAFEAMDEGISRQIRHQHQLTLSLLVDARHLHETNLEFREETKKRTALLDSCHSPGFQTVRRKASALLSDAVLFNGFIGFIPLVIPILFLIIPTALGVKFIQPLLAAPKSRFDELSDAQLA